MSEGLSIATFVGVLIQIIAFAFCYGKLTERVDNLKDRLDKHINARDGGAK